MEQIAGLSERTPAFSFSLSPMQDKDYDKKTESIDTAFASWVIAGKASNLLKEDEVSWSNETYSGNVDGHTTSSKNELEASNQPLSERRKALSL